MILIGVILFSSFVSVELHTEWELRSTIEGRSWVANRHSLAHLVLWACSNNLLTRFISVALLISSNTLLFGWNLDGVRRATLANCLVYSFAILRLKIALHCIILRKVTLAHNTLFDWPSTVTRRVIRLTFERLITSGNVLAYFYILLLTLSAF